MTDVTIYTDKSRPTTVSVTEINFSERINNKRKVLGPGTGKVETGRSKDFTTFRGI